jgi:hypothetical protein
MSGGNPAAQSFFSNSVLPLNDLNDIVFNNGVPTVRSLEKPLGRLHPLALAPMETFADKQVRTGRKLSDLNSVSEDWFGTKSPTFDRAVHYGPWSRAVSELRSTIDPRKTFGQTLANVLGYGNVSTYDTEAMKLRDIRNAYGAKLESDPNVSQYTNYYTPDYKEAKMTPSEKAEIDWATRRRAVVTKKIKKLFDVRVREKAGQ